jgi:membrane fusion protein, multidrug efflux system
MFSRSFGGVAALLAPLALLLLALAACDKAPPKPMEMPPPEVETVPAHRQTVPLTRDLVGRLAATRVAQVRARVPGVILHRVYKEGTDVQAGDVLFQIDPAQLEAKLHAEEAGLAKAEADATNAALTAKRYKELRGKNTLSQQDLDTAMANERTTAAAVKQAKANVEGARLDLSYATVRAPIAGRAGRALVTEGALVGQGETTPLTTIEQIDPIYANFSQSVGEVEQMQRAAAGDPGAAPKVEVILPSGTAYPVTGVMDFSDLSVDPGTGALSMRAVLPNPKKHLLPGMFVNLRLTAGQVADAFLLPQAALSRDAKGAFVFVVDGKGLVQQRRLETHGMTREAWIVTGDLEDGDRVIVSGLQKVKPGAPVRLATPGAQGATGGAAGAASAAPAAPAPGKS